jgi:hypothetical protein
MVQSPIRRSRRRLASALGALLVTGLASAGAQPVPAQAATRYGNDVSWPQCSKAQGGYGLPMPADSAAFVVIGLTKGLPFTANPCLAGQVAWASARSIPAQAYTIPAFPTAAQLSAYSSAGPWDSSTRLGQLANVGYAEGARTLTRLAAAGFAPRMVWVDVEARTAQPWPTGSRVREAENRALISGLLRKLDDAGYAYGIYTNTSGWTSITGSWWLPGVPAWVTVGRRTASDARAACARPAVSAGPVHLAQWFDDTRDSDLTCAAYTPTPPVPYPPAGAHDLDGDWHADLVARDGATGLLWLNPIGAGRVTIGQGWQSMDLVATGGDLSGDGVPDLVARQAGTGVLWLYPRSAAGGWLPRRSIGPGWDVMSAVLRPGDFSGDGVPDVLARHATTGQLWLYRGTGRGGLLAGTQVGHGWGAFDLLLGPGDVDGDGSPDVLARRASDGSLWLYRGNGRGGWLGSRQVGVGWGGFDLVAAPGDLTGDGAPDLVAREPGSGRLWIYPTDGRAGWRARIDRGTGWAAFDTLA